MWSGSQPPESKMIIARIPKMVRWLAGTGERGDGIEAAGECVSRIPGILYVVSGTRTAGAASGGYPASTVKNDPVVGFLNVPQRSSNDSHSAEAARSRVPGIVSILWWKFQYPGDRLGLSP